MIYLSATLVITSTQIIKNTMPFIKQKSSKQEIVQWASYSPVHSYNILAITHVLGFASDLGIGNN